MSCTTCTDVSVACGVVSTFISSGLLYVQLGSAPRAYYPAHFLERAGAEAACEWDTLHATQCNQSW